ncbi:photosynthetic complex assembly protein PuhC [Tropicibacter sp. S64]|uniref:photosynthetic complex assembly protein PuhC n=1 Tax=Tropicibacter sp. S64 TaxID=3415122 RepID=UPI003C7D62BF
MTSQTQSHLPDKEMIPRTLVRAVGALMLTVLVLVSLARLTDRPLIATPPDDPVVAERELRLSGDLSGAATVRAANGDLIADLTPEEGGFVSGVWRVILRERIKARAAADGSVILRRDAGGRLSIHDPSTGWSADLMGFGKDNARAFARLLTQ